jgi:hypothetical protein
LEQENIEKTDLSEPFVDAAKDIQGAFERHGTVNQHQNKRILIQKMTWFSPK